MKINWKQKLTSRKFWVAIVGLVTSIMVICNVDEGTKAQIVGLITAVSTAIAYIIGEGIADSGRIINTKEDSEELK